MSDAERSRCRASIDNLRNDRRRDRGRNRPWWRRSCKRWALPESDYCWQHDPEARRRRDAKRFADERRCTEEPVEHVLVLGRRRIGRRAYGRGGDLYGTTASCTCGAWKDRVNSAPSNGGNVEARRRWRLHVAKTGQES